MKKKKITAEAAREAESCMELKPVSVWHHRECGRTLRSSLSKTRTWLTNVMFSEKSSTA